MSGIESLGYKMPDLPPGVTKEEVLESYIPGEQWESEWLRTDPIDRDLVTNLIKDFYKKYNTITNRASKEVSVVVVDNPLDVILTMTTVVKDAYDKLDTEVMMKLTLPGATEPREIAIKMRWPIDFQERLVGNIHEVPFSETEEPWSIRSWQYDAKETQLAENASNLIAAWMSQWRRWTEYPRGWSLIKERRLNGVWGPVRRWTFYWNPLRSILNYSTLRKWPKKVWKPMYHDAYTIAKEAFLAFPFGRYCIVCERPTAIYTNGTGLHRVDGPAMEWGDTDAGLFAVSGVMVPRQALMGKGLTAAKVENTANAEARRVLMEVYGQENWLKGTGAVLKHSDGYGELWQRPQRAREDEDLLMLKVVNSTPEPDGSFKDYFLRVPPEMETAEQAVAWTFGYTGEDKILYKPRQET